jgi:hypothetical protein
MSNRVNGPRCSLNGEKQRQFLWGNLPEISNLGDCNEDKRIILQWILRK